MSEVRRHQRVTASGKRTTVRHHTRGGDKARREDEAEAAREAWADRNAPHVSSLPAAEPEPQAQGWWDDDEPHQEEWMAGEDDADEAQARAALMFEDAERRLQEPGDDETEARVALVEDVLRRRQEEREADAGEAEHEGHTFKVNRAPAYQPQGDHDFAKADPPSPTWAGMSRDERRQATVRYHAARDALAANAEREQDAGIDWETDEYHRLNNEYWEARKALPWWRTGG